MESFFPSGFFEKKKNSYEKILFSKCQEKFILFF